MFQSFFLFCGGVDSSLLRGDGYSHARKECAAVGAFVFLTAVLAAVFMGFAVASIDDRPAYFVSAALLWATFIFCLDRQIVMSIKKSDGRMKQTMLCLPRVVLACILGLVIAKPCEMNIFAPEIDLIIQQKDLQRQRKETDAKNQLISQNNAQVQQQIDVLAHDNTDMAVQERQLVNEITEAQSQVAATFGRPGSANRSAQMSRDRIRAVNEPQCQQLNAHILADRRLMDQYRRELKMPAPLGAPRERQGRIGMLEKLDAISEFGSSSSAANAAVNFITLLFVIIELLPVYTKLSRDSGSYDLRLASREKEIARREEESWAAFNQTSAERVQSMANMEMKKIQFQMEMLHQVIESKELDTYLARARTGLAKAFAIEIARNLKIAWETLSGYDNRDPIKLPAGFERVIGDAARQMAGERSRLEEIKAQIHGFSVLTVACLKQVKKQFLRRFTKTSRPQGQSPRQAAGEGRTWPTGDSPSWTQTPPWIQTTPPPVSTLKDEMKNNGFSEPASESEGTRYDLVSH